MSRALHAWLPPGVLVLGALLSTGVQVQQAPQLRGSLEEALPRSFEDMGSYDVEVPQAEAEVAGFTDYAMRVYERADSAAEGAGPAGPVPWASVYVGFYDQQMRGKTIHSPKNCLPGGGWEPLSSRPERLAAGSEGFTVNRYLLQNGGARALVLYWYQGRGRVAHDEYLVKWDLLRDAALKRRTDEALVRVVVPVTGSEDAAFELARAIALQIKPSIDGVLPI